MLQDDRPQRAKENWQNHIQYATYFSILGTIAGGEVTLSQIEGLLGERSLGGQMKVLEEDYGLIRKKRPIRSKSNAKAVRYEINDIFLRFWFRYFNKYRSLIEIKNYTALANLIKQEYAAYSGLVLERWFRQKMMESQQYVEIEGWWHPRRKSDGEALLENEIDIVAVMLNGTVQAFEVKRNKEKYSASLLRQKVDDMQSQVFHGADIQCSCLSLEDM